MVLKVESLFLIITNISGYNDDGQDKRLKENMTLISDREDKMANCSTVTL